MNHPFCLWRKKYTKPWPLLPSSSACISGRRSSSQSDLFQKHRRKDMKRTAVVRAVIIVFGAVVPLVVMHGTEAHAVARQSDPASLETGQRTCSAASLRGTFGFTATGTFAGSPVARVGLETFD